MNLDKEIRSCLHAQTLEYNNADRRIEKILFAVYEKGKIAGRKEERAQTLIFC